MKKEKLVPILIRLTKEQKEKVERGAKHCECSCAHFIRMTIDASLFRLPNKSK